MPLGFVISGAGGQARPQRSPCPPRDCLDGCHLDFAYGCRGYGRVITRVTQVSIEERISRLKCRSFSGRLMALLSQPLSLSRRAALKLGAALPLALAIPGFSAPAA